jgi:bifunctional DNA-binding transcriptional regulator/antitoxin component of YhaV-PrlF toxin-antitoxin module
MPTTRLREKSQVTLPSKLVKALGLRTDDPLAIELEGDRIVITRFGSSKLAPKSPMEFWASGRSSPPRTAAEIDADLRALRSEWDR